MTRTPAAAAPRGRTSLGEPDLAATATATGARTARPPPHPPQASATTRPSSPESVAANPMRTATAASAGRTTAASRPFANSANPSRISWSAPRHIAMCGWI